MNEPQPEKESLASWLGINRATLAVLVAIGGLGLSEELWRNFLALHLQLKTGDVVKAAGWVGVYAFFLNLLEGCGYIIGGVLAHRMGPRVALGVSALPMAVGFTVLLLAQQPFWIVAGALLITNWEPLSVGATFDVVGSEVPKNRRTIAFAVQSIQKRLPKVIGPLTGGLLFALGFWVNLTLAFAVLGLAVVVQAFLLPRMKAKEETAHVPLGKVLKDMPADLRMLLSAEILIRWGDWFVRDFALLYVVGVLGRTEKEGGALVALTSFVALLTYIPVGKLVDRAPSPKPFIGLTFFLFALFPFALVLLPKTGLPLSVALAIAFGINGLREMGEPARKALIASSFPKEVRARAVGLYWGLRSFFFCPAPLLASLLWEYLGGDATFLIGGCIGMLGTAWFWLRVRCDSNAKAK